MFVVQGVQLGLPTLIGHQIVGNGIVGMLLKEDALRLYLRFVEVFVQQSSGSTRVFMSP